RTVYDRVPSAEQRGGNTAREPAQPAGRRCVDFHPPFEFPLLPAAAGTSPNFDGQFLSRPMPCSSSGARPSARPPPFSHCRQNGEAPPISALGGICQGLVSEEVPFAIGWAASITDNVATEFAASFFRTLAAGQPISRAMNQARQAIRKTCDEMGYPAWTLPVL